MELTPDFLYSLIEHRYKSDQKRALYRNYIDGLVARGVPPILSFRHLADSLVIAPATLQAMAFVTEHFYHQFNIPKRDGGLRNISAPTKSLDDVQRWIAANILFPGFEVPPDYVAGYVSGRGILDHVAPHKGAEALVKFDVKNFFPSIRVESVCQIFAELGYSRSVSRTLASLVTYNFGLPQGATTSPQLSNLFMRSFDAEVSQYCREYGFVYTRYADDIVISGAVEVVKHLARLKRFFASNGLSLNHAKTRVYTSPKQIRFITGLILSGNEIRLPKSMRRLIRVQSHLLLKQLSNLSRGECVPLESKAPNSWRDRNMILDPIFPERILGKLNYWLNIEPANIYALSMRTKLQEQLAEF